MVSVKEARELVKMALPEKTKKLPGFTLWLTQEDEAHPPKCLTFDVLWSNPGPGSVHVGFWSVDMQTGDVWNPMLCEKINNPSLRAAQQTIRKRLGITEDIYRDAITHNPCCKPEKLEK
jgi:hypothetical protein